MPSVDHGALNEGQWEKIPMFKFFLHIVCWWKQDAMPVVKMSINVLPDPSEEVETVLIEIFYCDLNILCSLESMNDH